jgi:hypothetical protein
MMRGKGRWQMREEKMESTSVTSVRTKGSISEKTGGMAFYFS